MEFKIDRDTLLKPMSKELLKRRTHYNLGNVMMETRNGSLKITATDLDIIITENLICDTIIEGTTTTTAQVIYDIVRN